MLKIVVEFHGSNWSPEDDSHTPKPMRIAHRWEFTMDIDPVNGPTIHALDEKVEKILTSIKQTLEG